MKISRKFPIFLLFTTVTTALAIFMSMREVLRSSLETEIIKRGRSTTEAFASMNAPLLEARDEERLSANLFALANDPDVINARLADTAATVIASLTKEEKGTQLPAYLASNDGPSYYADIRKGAFHFRADVKRGNALLGTFVLTMSRTPLLGPLGLATTRALIFAAGITLVMSIFGVLFMRREIHPLRVISEAFGRIAAGDFSVRMPEDRTDEIGELASGFNHMLKRVDLFMRYNDKMIIERLIADESLARPGGRLRDVGVLFGDMRGYTAMSNRRNADQVVRIVNTYFHLYIECIAHWGGMVDKTMGDAIMAVFERLDGDALDSHKRRSVLALCYMKAASVILNRFLYARRLGGEELDIEPRAFGFAMATGRAIVGNIGSTRRMDYTVCGRVVNLASRLEGLTKHGEVIIDNFTIKGTSDIVRFETLPAVQPKGFSESEQVTPHRITALVEDETARLRSFLRKVFTYSFIKDMLMPGHLGAGGEQSWCHEAEALIQKMIDETPVTELFARVDTETGRMLEEAGAHPPS